MKVIFFGTSNVALPVLEKLNKDAKVLAVVTTPDARAGRKQELEESPVSVLAQELNLPVLKPEKVKNNPEILEQLRQYNADIFVVVSYGKILPLEVINMPPHKTVNVHFSLLPKYRGPSPIQYALLAGEKVTGTTIFMLDEEVDHGPILAQQEYGIDADDNFFTLSQKLAHKSAQIIMPILVDYTSGELQPKSQDHENASYTKIITKDDGRVDWEDTAQAIYNQFRAFYMWPGIWTTWNGKKIKLADCAPLPGVGAAGSFGTVTEDGVVICGNGSLLKINRLQMEGKREMSIKEFLNGYKEFTGSKLT